MTDLGRKLRRAKYRPRYITELQHLLQRPIHRDEILSLEETETILTTPKPVMAWSQCVRFQEKKGARFRNLVEQMHKLNASAVYVWIPLATDCGLVPPMSMCRVNFDFHFNFSPDGIVVILTSDLEDKLLLDFFEEPEGEEWLEIKVFGRHWGQATY